MIAGPALDALVAEFVMGMARPTWTPTHYAVSAAHLSAKPIEWHYWPWEIRYWGEEVPIKWEPRRYSLRIEEAWKVVERFVPHIRIECCATSEYYNGDKLIAIGKPCPWHCDIWVDNRDVCCVQAPSAPEAICLAALDAVGYK